MSAQSRVTSRCDVVHSGRESLHLFIPVLLRDMLPLFTIMTLWILRIEGHNKKYIIQLKLTASTELGIFIYIYIYIYIYMSFLTYLPLLLMERVKNPA